MSLQTWIDRIAKVETDGLLAIEAARTLEELVEIDHRVLSKKGELSESLKVLREASPEERPKLGARANEAKQKLERSFQAKKQHLEGEALRARLASERIDISMPARRVPLGSLHPIRRVQDEILAIFRRLGFEVCTGPEVETEFHNFDALNIRADHPARDMQDTFYLPRLREGVSTVLRTHTSPVQIRTMLEKKAPPVRILAPGAVFRSDYDVTHSPMFHQVEGLYVDRKVSFAELKGCLLFFAQEMFGSDTKIRLRPSYFPFVEPGAEVDVTCVICRGKKPGCRVCKDSGWLEILGAGMVHPEVLRAVNFDPSTTQGFAFGMGVERIAMLKFGIPDLRLLFENDIRFLRLFAGT